jgi:hypothetical protein
MEDILAVYTRPRDPDCPLVCLDETSKQLLAETRVPIPMKPGRPARCDYEYERNGTANLFMMFAPLEGWRHVKVTDRHTAVDYAHVLKDLADVHFASATTIVLVQDNLNIHSKASLYQAFPAAEARRPVERFEWHYTPKHGSWLDLAESELGVLSSQCLDRRIPDKQALCDEVAAWVHDRNADHATANWHFTTPDARIKLKHLYPAIWVNRATRFMRRSGSRKPHSFATRQSEIQIVDTPQTHRTRISIGFSARTPRNKPDTSDRRTVWCAEKFKTLDLDAAIRDLNTLLTDS